MRNRHKYPLDWYDTIRPYVLKRDNYTCKHCGIRHRQIVIIEKGGKWTKVSEDLMSVLKEENKKIYRCLLNVAHIDQDKSNNNYNNLMSLCSRCHARFDAPYKVKRGKCVQYKNQLDIMTELHKKQLPPSLAALARSVSNMNKTGL